MGGPLAAIVVGFGSGVLTGLFGIGGGLVTTPAIRLLLGYGEFIAVGTPLPVILPGAVTGALAYRRRGLADVRAGLLMGAVGGLTSMFGAFLSDRAGGPLVLVVTAGVIVGAAVDLIWQELRWRPYAEPAEPVAGEAESDEALLPGEQSEGRASARRLAAIGLVAGIYSGFLGLGGGFIVVPGLTRFCGFSVKRAIGTSLITVAAIVVPGSVAHGLYGHVDWPLAAVLAIGVVPGAMLGAGLTKRASDRTIRLAFAALLLVVAAWLVANELPGLRL